MGRTLIDALAAELALGEIDVCEIPVQDYGSVGAGLDADAAADARVAAGLAGRGSLVVVSALNHHAHAARTLVAEFDKMPRARLHACAACRTSGLVHNRKACDGIHAERAEAAGGNAVAAAKAAVGAQGVAAVKRSLYLAGFYAVVLVHHRAHLAGAVATQHSKLGSLFLDRVAEYGGHLFHHFVAAYGTEVPGEALVADGRGGEVVAARIAAAAAVGSRKSLFDLVDAGVLNHLELLRYEVQEQSQQQTQTRENHNGPDDSISHFPLYKKSIRS